jgi:hypothetical protein
VSRDARRTLFTVAFIILAIIALILQVIVTARYMLS